MNDTIMRLDVDGSIIVIKDTCELKAEFSVESHVICGTFDCYSDLITFRNSIRQTVERTTIKVVAK